MFYDLAAPTWGHEEIEIAKKVLDSGMYTMGARVKAFEEEFARYMGAKYAIMVNSGSSANLVAVAAFAYRSKNPLKRGDEVIVPTLSWATTYHPLQQYGLHCRFVDIDLQTLNMDTKLLEKALTPKTKAIVAVSILGNPAALDTIRSFADQHGLAMLEDNCESMDAELNGKKCGTFGHLNTFSFFFSHHISTMEGGMILTDDFELDNLCRAIRAHGWTRDLPANSPIYQKRTNDHFEAYRFIMPGYNVRPLEIEAAIGQEQLKKLPGFTAKRRQNMALFNKFFKDDERFIIQKENGKSSIFSFTIILNPSRKPDRSQVFAALKDADIGYRIITGGNFLRHDAIKYYDYDVVNGSAPNSDLAHDFGFFVGNHPFDLAPQITKLHDVLNKVCR